MASYADVEREGWNALLEELRPRMGQSATLEAAAAPVVSELYRRFEAQTALARLYVVAPYRELEPRVASFVDVLAANAGQAAAIEPSTPVLTLLGTHGAREAWCDRKASQGHVAIPLVSAAFVQNIPMVARLLKEIGVDLSWLDAAPEVNARRLLGGFNGLFYVDDARTARDAEGRLVIPAQDFVAEERVKTVFGMGGFYPDGTLVALIVFTRERLQRIQVERLTSLLTVFKGETFGVVRARKLFG